MQALEPLPRPRTKADLTLTKMSVAWKKPCPVEAWASSVGLRYGEGSRSNGKDTDDDSNLKIKKVYHRTHLKLIDKALPVEVPASSEEDAAVDNVQHVESSAKAAKFHAQKVTLDKMFPAAAQTCGSHKLKDVESSASQSGAVRSQPKETDNL